MYGQPDELLLRQGPLVEEVIEKHRKFLADPKQTEKVSAVAAAYAPFRPPLPVGAPIEVIQKSDPTNCSLLPFAVARADGAIGSGIFRTVLVRLLTESLSAYADQRKSGAEWKLPADTAAKLSHIRLKLERAKKERFAKVPAEIDLDYALIELSDLAEGRRFPPGIELLSEGEITSSEIQEIVSLLIDEIEQPSWEQFLYLTVNGNTQEKALPTEVPLILSEAGAPLACLMERLHRSQFSDPRKSKLRPLVVGYLALSNRTWINPLAKLSPEVLRDAASLIGKHGQRYVRWILLLQLWGIFEVTQVNFDAIMLNRKIQGLDYLKVTQLPALVRQAMSEVKKGEVPTNCKYLCNRLRRELDANWDKSKKKIYVPDDFKTYLRWLKLAVDIAEFLEEPAVK